MSQQQEQTKKQPFRCFLCNEIVKLTRKPDNSGWNRYELDGTTVHECNPQKKVVSTGTELAAKQQEQQQPPSLYEKISAIEKRLDSIQALLEILLKK